MKKFNSFLEVINTFDTELKCIKYLTAIIYKDGFYCPFCNSKKIYHFSNNKTHKCAECRKKFGVKIGTIFEDSKISLKKWFMAIYLMTSHKKGISSLQLSKDIKVTQKTAWYILQRLRYAVDSNSFKKPLKGIVEVDETYIGGKETNKHKNKRTKEYNTILGDKKPILGMVEKKGSIKYQSIEKATKGNVKPIIESNISDNAIIHTDESPIYKFLPKDKRKIVNHTFKEYVGKGGITTNNIEGSFAHFKRTINGIYHSASKKHIQKYADMFCFRWNTRGYSIQERINEFFSLTSGKRLQYKELING